MLVTREQDVVVAALDDVDRIDLDVTEVLDGGLHGGSAIPERSRLIEPLGGEPKAASRCQRHDGWGRRVALARGVCAWGAHAFGVERPTAWVTKRFSSAELSWRFATYRRAALARTSTLRPTEDRPMSTINTNTCKTPARS